MIKQDLIKSNVLRVGGIFTIIFSVAMGLLILFVIPGACTFVGGLQLLVLGFLFIVGVLLYVLGKVWQRR